MKTGTRACLIVGILLHLTTAQQAPAPIVDLGYERYRGYYDSTTSQNVYRGIRFAAPPVGKLRWQLPEAPAENRGEVISAVEFPSQCPQSALGRIRGFVPDPQLPEDEDCLFLNVEAPANKTKLPVLVSIHGGGYGLLNGATSFSQQIKTNDNTYLVVSIQYRLGAFGFASSAEVARHGVLNVGIHDQRFALQWVQKYVHLFGGDPEEVTIWGVSAGGGSVMLHAMANGGTEGTSLFKGAIAGSPYVPTQWDYNGRWPTQAYEALAREAGCTATTNISTFECLVSADTGILRNASNNVSKNWFYGQWAFIPVTDGTFIEERPSTQLHVEGRVNGLRVITSNSLNEAPNFTPRNITDEAAFLDFVRTNYPLLTDKDISRVLSHYAVPPNSSSLYTDSSGLTPPFSTTNSQWAVGWQQAAANLYAETTFHCPANWLADAFAMKKDGFAWRIQFSVPTANHGSEWEPLTSAPTVSNTGIDVVFRTALQKIWGNFVTKGDPRLNASQVGFQHSRNITAARRGNWPLWGGTPSTDFQLNLNMTGGMPVSAVRDFDGKPLILTGYLPSNGSSPPLEAVFEAVSAWTWEGGRGRRCQLWADLSARVLEK